MLFNSPRIGSESLGGTTCLTLLVLHMLSSKVAIRAAKYDDPRHDKERGRIS